MTIAKLTQRLVDKLPYLSKEDAEFSIHSVLDYLKSELVAGNRIEVRGFGSFSVRQRKHPRRDVTYNTTYYRMSKNIQSEIVTLDLENDSS